MKRFVMLAAVSAGLGLPGCTTTSFAPPPIITDRATSPTTDENCVGKPSVSGPSRPGQVLPDERITPSVEGAFTLIDNFLIGYRCAAHEMANGRQSFEIPSFLGLIAAAVGRPLYGFTENEALAAVAYSGVMTKANSYYAPKAKAKLLYAALDGVVCVKTASVGFDHFSKLRDSEDPAPEAVAAKVRANGLVVDIVEQEIQRLDKERERDDLSPDETKAMERDREALRAWRSSLTLKLAEDTSRSSVTIKPSRAYFELVAAALYEIERSLAIQLSDAGSFSAEQITTALEQAIRRENTATEGQENLRDGTNKNFTGLTAQQKEELMIELKLDELNARLAKCVVRAKVA